MTTLKAANLYDVPFYGEYGNLSIAESTITGASIANGTDTIDFMVIPAQSKVYDWQMLNNAFTGGTSPTLSLGWRYADGSAGGGAAVLLAATAMGSAARTRAAAATVTPILVDKDIVIYGTSGGSGTSTAANVTVLVNYRVMGTK